MPYRRPILILMVFCAVGVAQAAPPRPLDWDAWRHLPVFSNGRAMPLDTFARETVEAICGDANPTLVPPNSFIQQSNDPKTGENSPTDQKDSNDTSKKSSATDAAMQRLFPDGQPRTFSSAELLFAWIVEPKVWARVPLLAVADPELREKLRLPLTDRQGRPMRYASMVELENSETLGQLWGDLQKRSEAEGKQFKFSGLDKKVKTLVDAYDRFRLLMFDPQSPEEPHNRFFSLVHPAIATWKSLAVALPKDERLRGNDAIRQAMVQAGEALTELASHAQDGEFSLEKMEKPVASFRNAAAALADELANRPADPSNPTNPALIAMAAELRRQTQEMHTALYDDGETLRLIPSLNIAALEGNREPEEDAQPWLSVQALLVGSEALLHDYPQSELQAVRTAFTQVKEAYLDQENTERPQRFSAAMRQFSDAMQAFGDRIQPLREKLPIRHREPTLLSATAYPSASFGRAEVFYNRLSPFFWAWVVSLAAIVCLSLSWGRQRNAMFWLGVGVLSIALALILVGFAIRMHATGLIPLTGMFETVVFVALAVAVLGLGFALWPLAQFGLSDAWNATALCPKQQFTSQQIPFGTCSTENDTTKPRPVSPTMRWTGLALRGILTAVLFGLIVRWPGRANGGIFDLLPQSALGTVVPSINDVLVWLAGICIILIVECYLPRCVLAFCIALVTVPLAWIRHGVSEAMEDVMRRRFFVLGGAAMCCLAVAAACFAPATVMKRNLGAVAPILRDNHWLVVHVVTIMASYASAAIALVLGNIALGHYLFGSYRKASSQTVDPNTTALNTIPSNAKTSNVHGFTGRRLPPEACATLAGFIYAAVRVTVLLLAAGTILGALWADKSWGRFWGWDPKEVWALISLLVYLLILHARSAGWAGDFGMAMAAVLGATTVLITWYGVNFVLNSGMHAYGAGSGGQGWPVVAAVVANWLFLLAAFVRYVIECGRANPHEENPTEKTPPTGSLGKATSFMILLLFFGLGMASPAVSQQLAVIEKMPEDLFQYTGGAKPNAQGMVSDNRDGFKSPEFQRGAMHYMMRAIARGDAAGVNEAWPAIDATFAHQTEEGGLSRKGSPLGGPSALAIWLAELDQTMLVLRESKLEPQFHDRIEKLIPKIHRAARWLMQSKYQTYLLREDAQTPNRLLFDALAFGLSGVLTDDAELKQTGRRFVDAAVTLFRPSDGVFLEKGGPDSSYQAVAALKLQVWLIYFPDPKLAAIVDQAVTWELGRVQPDGQVEVTGNTRTGLGQEQWMGRTKGVNLSEVTLCLLYHFARTGNQPSQDAARRIVERRRE